MGQRLNLEIIDKNGEVIANCYYHWSAYTDAALETTEAALTGFQDFDPDSEIEKLNCAMNMLLATGATIPSKEKAEYFKKVPDKERILFGDEEPDRNAGLIAVSEKGIEETQDWMEGRVAINIDTKEIDFDVLFNDDGEDYDIEDRKRDYVLTDFTDMKYSLPAGIPFNRFSEFSEEVMASIKNGDQGFTLNGTIYNYIM